MSEENIWKNGFIAFAFSVVSLFGIHFILFYAEEIKELCWTEYALVYNAAYIILSFFVFIIIKGIFESM